MARPPAGEPARGCPARDPAEGTREALFREVQRLESVGVLTRGIVHRINNLLLPIMVLTEISMRRLPADDETQGRLRRVHEAAGQIAKIVSQVLSFSRAEPPARSAFDLRAAVAETASLLKASLASSITLAVADGKDAGPLELLADRAQIQQALIHLVTNRAEAGGADRRRIDLALGRLDLGEPRSVRGARIGPGSFARLTVSDDGPGLPEAALPALFDPQPPTRWAGIGETLGLTVADGIVANHGGAIEVASAEGRGTLIEVYLPLGGLTQPGNGGARRWHGFS